MALRLWSRRVSGLSHLLPACQQLLSTSSNSLKTFASSAADGAVVEDHASERKRLSRQERTALVESFVVKHMEAHGGAFPSVSCVLKETGGGRSAVKDILSDVESRLMSKQASSDHEDSDHEDSDHMAGAPSTTEGDTHSETSSSGDEASDEEDDNNMNEEFEATEGEETTDELDKPVTFTNGQMIGSSNGEIETHSELWSRLRKLGTQSYSPKQKQNAQTDSTDQNEAPKGQEERHGLFIRYLSSHATSVDLKEAFDDCGEIIRAQAIKPRSHQRFTYGFVDFKTSEALQKALEKERVYIKGVRIRKEPSSSTPKVLDRNENLNPLAVDSPPPRSPDSFLGPPEAKGRGTGYSVSVEGVPLHIPLTAVKKALSKYGEIALSSKKQVGKGDYAAHVEFKVDDGRVRALAAKTVQLHGMHYTILRVDSVMTSVVRLSNVAAGTSAEQIQSSCEQVGRVEKVVTRCDGIVDVYFHSTESKNMPRIMNRLNEVQVDGQCWQAQPSSCIDPSSFSSLMRTRSGQERIQDESERVLERIEGTLRRLVVDVEDLHNVVKMKREHIS